MYSVTQQNAKRKSQIIITKQCQPIFFKKIVASLELLSTFFLSFVFHHSHGASNVSIHAFVASSDRIDIRHVIAQTFILHLRELIFSFFSLLLFSFKQSKITLFF